MNAPTGNAPRTLRLNASDNVVTAVDPIDAGAGAYGATASPADFLGHGKAPELLV